MSHPNQPALSALRALLQAAHDFSFQIDGRAFEVSAERSAPGRWPRLLSGLQQAQDGPWPTPARLTLRWEDGRAEVELLVDAWGPTDGDLVGIRAASLPSRRELLWISVGHLVQSAGDSPMVAVWGFAGVSKRKDEDWSAQGAWYANRVRELANRAGLPKLTPSRVELFRMDATGALMTDPAEAFERLVKLVLLKLPFQLRGGLPGIEGAPPLSIEPPSGDLAEQAPQEGGGQKHFGLWPLPGGVRNYKRSLDRLLGWIAEVPRPLKEFNAYLEASFDVYGPTAMRTYSRLLATFGLIEEHDEVLEISPAGERYLAEPSGANLFHLMDAAFAGMLEALVGTHAGYVRKDALHEALCFLLEKRWATGVQTSYRRNWLLSMGLTERSREGDTVTEAGEAVLADFPERGEMIRARLLAMPSRGESEENEEDVEDGPSLADFGLDESGSAADGEAPDWFADRLDLTTQVLESHLGPLRLSHRTLQQAAAALSTGKHLLLVGPPGTGKTGLAIRLAAAAASEGYCRGAFTATASADWTTFDTIGGYALQRSGELAFRSGAFLQALERRQWLIIDELNRADIDRAFGELMTVLSGKGTDTPYQGDGGQPISIGPERSRSHRVPRTFRVVATMNTWDKTSLFRLSYAVQRRFAMIHIGAPGDQVYQALIETEASREGMDMPLAQILTERVAALFRWDRLLSVREIGPAVALDLIRYLRRRAEPDGLAEGIALFLLAQLEGLDDAPAAEAYRLLDGAVTGLVSPEAHDALRGRWHELFPHLDTREP